MSVEVRPVGSRQERRAFLSFPWLHYQGDPLWTPPLRQNQKELVGYARHPFYDDAEAQTFLAWRGGQVVGRVAAILNHAYNRFQNEQRGFFGFFEAVDDQSVADALLAAVRDWLAERGIRQVRGPANPSQNYEWGLLVEGFHRPATFMLTYNPPYYARLLEGCGFRKAHDLYAYWGNRQTLDGLDDKLRFITAAAEERFVIHTRPLNKRHFRREVQMFLDIYNRSAAGIWGFVPLSPAEIHHLSLMLRFLIIPELARVAEVDGRPVGAVFGLPDYNPRIKEIDGRLLPWGFLRLISPKRDLKRLRMISTNVLPEYQRWGVGLVLLKGLIPKFLEYGMTEGEFSWVAESNKLSRGSLEKGGALLERTYRVYDYDPPA
jgi:GNAT superfamily N-acetyltransferase